MIRCLVGIGSNLGDRAVQMDAAVLAISKLPQVDLVKVSEWMETVPVGGPEKQQSYLNGALVVDTTLSAPGLLSQLLDVERGLGRERDQRWGPRSVDLDLLLYDDQHIQQPGLTVPHPWMAIRRFVIEPAESVAAEMIHPLIGWSLERLGENLRSRPLRIAAHGAGHPSQLSAIHAAAQESAARLIRLDDILDELSGKAGDKQIASCRDEIRPFLSGETSAVSHSVARLESLREEIVGEVALRVKTVKTVKTATAEPETIPILFDFWWGRDSAGQPANQVESTSLSWRPNLLINIENNGTEKSKDGKVRSGCGYEGPSITLSGEDAARLQHDVTAAIQGMQ